MRSQRTESARVPETRPAGEHRGRWRALPAVLLAALLAQFDLFVINVAAPSLEAGLHTTTGVVQLAVGGYSITYGTLLVAGGRLGDVYGPRRLIRLGMTGFAVTSAACALAQTGPQLVGARLVQGACAALMVPQVLALVTRLFPPGQRGRATAWFGVTLGVGAVAGQALGGYLVGHAPLALAWRSIFLVVVPLALLGTLLVGRLVPVDDPVAGHERPHLDLAGLLGLTAGLMCVFVAVIGGPGSHRPAWTWLLAGLGALCLLATVCWERMRSRRGKAVVIDLALFRQPMFRVGLGVITAYYGAFGGVLFVLTFTLQQGLGQSPEQSGLTFVPQGAAFAIASLAGARLIQSVGPLLITIGAGASCTACLLLLVSTATGGIGEGPAHLWPIMALLGVGNGLAIPAMIASVLGVVAPSTAGAAAGLLTTTQQIAMAFGVAVLGSVQFGAVVDPTDQAGYLAGLRITLVVASALLLLAGLASTVLHRRRT